EPELHHGNKALSAGEEAAIIAKPGQQQRCFADRVRSMVGERCRNHAAPPAWQRLKKLESAAVRQQLLVHGRHILASSTHERPARKCVNSPDLVYASFAVASVTAVLQCTTRIRRQDLQVARAPKMAVSPGSPAATDGQRIRAKNRVWWRQGVQRLHHPPA